MNKAVYKEIVPEVGDVLEDSHGFNLFHVITDIEEDNFGNKTIVFNNYHDRNAPDFEPSLIKTGKAEKIKEKLLKGSLSFKHAGKIGGNFMVDGWFLKAKEQSDAI